MKHFFYFMLLCVITLFITCKNDEEDSLTIDYAPAAILETGGSTTFTIHTNRKWTAASNVSWIKITPASGDGDRTVRVTVQHNTDAESDTPSRTAKIYVTAGVNVEVVNINQQESNLPVPPAPVISGLSSNECPYFSTIQLTATPVEHAVSYIWYNGANVVQSGTATTYNAITSGIYTVAGVNKVGREGARSPEKPVAITYCMPEAAGSIIGASANNCYAATDRENVMLTVPAVLHATYYIWRRNGIPVANTTTSAYIAAESGTYTVAGANSIGQGVFSPEKSVSISRCLYLGAGKTYSSLTVNKSILNTSEGNSIVEPFLTVCNNMYNGAATPASDPRTIQFYRLSFDINDGNERLRLTIQYNNPTGTNYVADGYFKVNRDPDGAVYFTDFTTPGGNMASIGPRIVNYAPANNLFRYLLYSGTAAVGTATIQSSGNKFKIDWASSNTPGVPELGAFYLISNPADYMPGILQ